MLRSTAGSACRIRNINWFLISSGDFYWYDFNWCGVLSPLALLVSRIIDYTKNRWSLTASAILLLGGFLQPLFCRANGRVSSPISKVCFKAVPVALSAFPLPSGLGSDLKISIALVQKALRRVSWGIHRMKLQRVYEGFTGWNYRGFTKDLPGDITEGLRRIYRVILHRLYEGFTRWYRRGFFLVGGGVGCGITEGLTEGGIVGLAEEFTDW